MCGGGAFSWGGLAAEVLVATGWVRLCGIFELEVLVAVVLGWLTSLLELEVEVLSSRLGESRAAKASWSMAGGVSAMWRSM